MGDGEKVYKRFTELEAWQYARSLKLAVYTFLPRLPPEEKYELTSQLRRAVRSIVANISEGYGRYTYKDQLHFCIQARGSLTEVHNHLIDAVDCQYLTLEGLDDFEQKIYQTEKILNGYISWLRKMSQQ